MKTPKTSWHYARAMNSVDRIRWYFRIRLPARIRIIRNSGNELRARVKVEQELLDCANGKQELPDADKCRQLAYRLGVREN